MYGSSCVGREKKIHCTDKDNPLNSVNILSLNSLLFFSWILKSQINKYYLVVNRTLLVYNIFLSSSICFVPLVLYFFWTMCNMKWKCESWFWSMGSEQNTQDTSNSMNQYRKVVQHRYFEINMRYKRLLYILEKLRRWPRKHVL